MIYSIRNWIYGVTGNTELLDSSDVEAYRERIDKACGRSSASVRKGTGIHGSAVLCK